MVRPAERNRFGPVEGVNGELLQEGFGDTLSPERLDGLKDYRTKLKGARYSRDSVWQDGMRFGFIPSNAKATNDYRQVAAMAYLCNTYHHPVVKEYFESQGVPVYDDLYALSQMVQWIWRSRIRDEVNQQPIHVFIPSERMRGLLKRWLQAASTIELVREVDPANPYFMGMVFPGSEVAEAQPVAA